MNNFVNFQLLIVISIAISVNCASMTHWTHPLVIQKQLNCALDREPCDVMGQRIKDMLPEVIGNNCANCNPAQFSRAKKMALLIQTQYPEEWDALLQKYSSDYY